MSNLESEGKHLLEEHQILFDELKNIPSIRDISFRIDEIDEHHIGKPRFLPEKYVWNKDLLINLRNHLQNIWKFFEKYSYWFDSTIKPILDIHDRRRSKKSIIFLLENDLWETDEIYGDYLIEDLPNKTIISYYRRGQKRKEINTTKLSINEIEIYISHNAREQVINQFIYLWNLLKDEITICIKEFHVRIPTKRIFNSELSLLFEKCKELAETHPEAALLSLGRISELWLIDQLGFVQRSDEEEDLIKKSRNKGVLNPSQERLFRSIRRNYNSLKHNLEYNVIKDDVLDFFNKFQLFLNQQIPKVHKK